MEQLFSTKSKARILNCCFLLQSTKKGSSTVEAYFLKMKSLAHDLALARRPLSEVDLVLFVLGGLGSEYESVVVNLTSEDSLTLPEAQFMLQNQESRLKALDSSISSDTPSHASAYLAHRHALSHTPNAVGQSTHTSRSRSSWSGPRGRGSCGCGGGFSSSSKLLFQICGKAGHLALKCYHHFDISNHGHLTVRALSTAHRSS